MNTNIEQKIKQIIKKGHEYKRRWLEQKELHKQFLLQMFASLKLHDCPVDELYKSLTSLIFL